MTFLATYDGELAPGYVDGQARTCVFEGQEFYDWPQPWGYECDDCGVRFEYGCVAMRERDKLVPPTMRQIGGDHHRCAFCEGYVVPSVQLDLFGAAA